jgi:hypothetical protein
MASDASVALGAPQIAGTFVNPKGFARQVAATVAGGAVGGAIGGAVAGGVTRAGTADLPEFGRVGYVAVSADEVALVRTKSGLIKMKITDEVLARQPRNRIASTTLEKGALKSTLTIQFADGGAWVFDVPKANQRGATQVVQALGGTID